MSLYSESSIYCIMSWGCSGFILIANNLFIYYLEAYRYVDYYYYCVYIYVSIFFLLVLLFAFYFLSNTLSKKFSIIKLDLYECGFESLILDAHWVLNMQYFRVLLVFLIFDLEVLYIFPWILISKFFIFESFYFLYYTMFPFFLFLLLGILYEYLTRVINWYNFSF